jgi:hypothetical protein
MDKKVLRILNYLAVGVGVLALGLLLIGIIRALLEL